MAISRCELLQPSQHSHHIAHVQLRRGWHDLRMPDQEWQSQLQQSICRHKQVEAGEGSWTPFRTEGDLACTLCI